MIEIESSSCGAANDDDKLYYPNGENRWVDGSARWYLNDELHRVDGPACEHPDGTKWWLINGKLHREDGPAIELPDGTKRWYLKGQEILVAFSSVKEFQSYIRNKAFW